ncbi:4-alpha-glucanotransferase [Candidatus Formimonas warabiya]|uniref:4-alpha-glucanotransferase n=1 Tax=Formimonas warabiya TaxID=1761012 RepID=A0A3G1L098_FORW1|nr:4-alpha-glucanotransferase [Candidatus Formimonas warabiya]ATW28216.1 4-alpha-glucanotransferase [Candidatus Formimonas warabiya]
MKLNRDSGILLHVTSLPSLYGMGDLGEEAYRFVDFLARSHQGLWQVLPLNPPDVGESPYQCFSAFAGNPLMIGLDLLMKSGLLEERDLVPIPLFTQERVNFDAGRVYKEKLLHKAYQRFQNRQEQDDYLFFLEKNAYWLPDFVLFMALKKHFHGKPWYRWEETAARRERRTLESYTQILHEEMGYQKFLQFVFFRQWSELKKYAADKGIRIMGDLPIFVSADSSDVWSHQELFQLDEKGLPLKVAGVPPDYFSRTGQWWGNPHYRWDQMKGDHYRWWRERFTTLLGLVDLVRIDHFRGFEASWEIPAGEGTAVKGTWVKGPGEEFFAALEKYLGPLPAIAEDLGYITPGVIALKEKFGYPGMRVLQFAFQSGTTEAFSPRGYDQSCVVYTGTHDNDTAWGWFQNILKKEPKAAALLKKYLGLSRYARPSEVCWTLMEFAFSTRAALAVVPLQDVLCLGSDARMNFPGTAQGNWQWRFLKKDLTGEIEKKLRELTFLYNR